MPERVTNNTYQASGSVIELDQLLNAPDTAIAVTIIVAKTKTNIVAKTKTNDTSTYSAATSFAKSVEATPPLS